MAASLTERLERTIIYACPPAVNLSWRIPLSPVSLDEAAEPAERACRLPGQSVQTSRSERADFQVSSVAPFRKSRLNNMDMAICRASRNTPSCVAPLHIPERTV